jgi:hypothetical protein
VDELLSKLPGEGWMWAVGALGPMIAALAAGRFLRRLVLKPFELWAAKTENKFDDQLVHDAEHDLGIEDK